MKTDSIATGFDGHLHIRTASDLLPRMHAVARRKGLTAAAWTRMIIIEAIDRAAILETVRTGTSGIGRGERILRV